MLADSRMRNGARPVARWSRGRVPGTDPRGSRRAPPTVRRTASGRDPTARARSRAARRRRPGGARRAVGPLRGVIERRDVDGCAGAGRPRRGIRVEAEEEIGLVVVGDRGPLVERHEPVVVAREKYADAEARLDQRLEAARDRQRQVLLDNPLGAPGARVLPAMARIDGDRPERRGCLAEDWQVGRRRRRGRRGGRFGDRRHQVDGQPRGVPGGLGRGAHQSEARAELDRQRRGVGHADRLHEALRQHHRHRHVEQVGLEPNHQPAGLLHHGAAGARRRVDCEPRRVDLRLVPDRQPRHAHVADDQQSRRAPQFETGVVNRGERAVDELERDEPPPAEARDRRREGRRAGPRPTPGPGRA